LLSPTLVNAHSLIADVAGVPRTVLAAAVLIVRVVPDGVRVVEKLLNTFSVTTPPMVTNPPTVRFCRVPTDVSEELLYQVLAGYR